MLQDIALARHSQDRSTKDSKELTAMRTFSLLCLLAICAPGCATLNSINAEFPWSPEKKREQLEKTQPVRIVSFWSEMMINSTTRKPVRGFGGRVYFYNKAGKPVKVDGELSVYAYDDTDKDAETASRAEPDKIFTYRKEEFANYYSKSEIGESYSIWLPWDGVDGDEKKISLVAKFVMTSGEVVRGPMELVTLTGKKKKSKAQPLSDSQRFLKKQLESQFGAEADEIAAMLYSGKAPAEWVDEDVKQEIKSRRNVSKEIPLTESMIEKLNAAGEIRLEELPEPIEERPSPRMPSSRSQRQEEEEYVEPVRGGYTRKATVPAASFIAADPKANSAHARRYGLQRNQLLNASSQFEQAAPLPAASLPSQKGSRHAPRSGPEPVVTERGPAKSEFERTPDWLSSP